MLLTTRLLRRSRDTRLPPWLREALGAHVSNGLAAALGLLLISGAVHLVLGAHAASAATVGVIVCIAPDQAAPRRGKFLHLLPAPLVGLPLFFAVHVVHDQPLLLGALLVPATFLAFLAGAWGQRGLPIVVSIMFALLFAMAEASHARGGTAGSASAWFALGAGAYLLWATAANALLNARYRRQTLADVLLSLAGLMRTQAACFSPDAQDEADAAAAARGAAPAPVLGRLLQRQAALTDQLQGARNLLLESPRTARRQQLAGLLMQVLELRDHLLACELDLEALKAHPGHAPVLAALRAALQARAQDVEQLADALLLDRLPAPCAAAPLRVESLPWDAVHAGAAEAEAGARLARSLAYRVRHVDQEVTRTVALARGEQPTDLAAVRVAWQMFVSPTAWSWRPFLALWRRDAPALRTAVRAALAVGSAYALSLVLPWAAHAYWILLTIVVVLRGSLAQTLERRNSRVLGTLLGCALAAVLLWAQPASWALLLVLTLAQAVAHAFAVRRYLVTSVAATVLGLVQAHLLGAGAAPVFNIVERVADTLLGVAIAWGFSYVLPSWERQQLPALLARVLRAQARHARVALGLAQLQAIDDEPELAWRLARREAYDSLSALVQATRRSLAEPGAVRPPLQPLERLLAHGYQLLAQLTALKTMLLLQRARLQVEALRTPLTQAMARIDAALVAPPPAAGAAAPGADSAAELPAQPPDAELTPWALRRLELAAAMAAHMRADAQQLLQALAPPRAPPG